MTDAFPLPATPEQLVDNLLHAYSAGQPGNDGPVPRGLRPDLRLDTAPVHPLPSPAPEGRSLYAALDARRSVRNFAPTPLTGAVLAATLAAAREHDARTAPGENQAGNGLTPVVAMRRVTGFEPGVYGAAPAAPTSLCRYGPLTRTAWHSLFPDAQVGSAPALVLMIGSLGAAWHRHGARGHLRLLRRAGSAAHAGWLAALQRGCGAVILGATLPSPELSATARLDPISRRPLIAMALGDADPDPPSRAPATASVRH